jgi:hypothetical protein
MWTGCSRWPTSNLRVARWRGAPLVTPAVCLAGATVLLQVLLIRAAREQTRQHVRWVEESSRACACISRQADLSLSSLQAAVCRAELKAALELDRLVSSSAGGPEQAGKPSLRTLGAVALAVGLPFIGFGFFDNFIMVRPGHLGSLAMRIAVYLPRNAAARVQGLHGLAPLLHALPSGLCMKAGPCCYNIICQPAGTAGRSARLRFGRYPQPPLQHDRLPSNPRSVCLHLQPRK